MIRCGADDRWLMADGARDWKIGYELFTLRNYYCSLDFEFKEREK